MTRYELIAPPGSPVDLGVFLVHVDRPEDNAALSHFRRAGWAVLWIRSRDPRARGADAFKLSASDLRRAIERGSVLALNSIGRSLCPACRVRAARLAYPSNLCRPCQSSMVQAAIKDARTGARPDPTT